MHGGQGYYLDEKLSLILVDIGGGEEYKGITYPFDIWSGCIFPVEKIKQGRVFIQFPFLENHPASPLWLYLPLESENFEENVRLVLREIIRRNPLYGVPIKTKSRKSDQAGEDDPRRPQIFSEKKKTKKPVRKKTVKKKIKADKKSENSLLLSIIDRRRN